MVAYHELCNGPCFKFYFVARLSYLVFIPFFVARLTHPPTQRQGDGKRNILFGGLN